MYKNEIFRNATRIWCVIEGDNGAGKDTLANYFTASGFVIINTLPVAQDAEKHARSLIGQEKVNAFLEYNRACATLAQEVHTHAVQIRYWPSTLAAAYADDIMTWDQVQEAADRQATSNIHPTLFFYLECDLEERIKRIASRGPILNKYDNISSKRATRHKKAILSFSARCIQWRNIDCTYLQPHEVFAKATCILNSQETK